MPNLVLIGPAVRPAIGNRQTDKHIAFYYVDKVIRGSDFCQNVWPWIFVAELREFRLLIYCILSLQPCQLPRKVSNETNNCLHTLYRSKLTAASRRFPATALLSCCVLWSCLLPREVNRDTCCIFVSSVDLTPLTRLIFTDRRQNHVQPLILRLYDTNFQLSQCSATTHLREGGKF